MLTTYFARLCAQIANFFTNFSALTVRALGLAQLLAWRAIFNTWFFASMSAD